MNLTNLTAEFYVQLFPRVPLRVILMNETGLIMRVISFDLVIKMWPNNYSIKFLFYIFFEK